MTDTATAEFAEVRPGSDWNEPQPGVRVAWMLDDQQERAGQTLLSCWIAPSTDSEARRHPFKPGGERTDTAFYLCRVRDSAHAGRVQRRWPEGLPDSMWSVPYEPNMASPRLTLPLAPDFF